MFHLKFFSCLFLIGLLLCPAGIHSQNVYDEDEYYNLDEAGGIVISASRTPESAAGVPAQVTVITAEDIAASGEVSITGVLETVPGIRFSGALSGAGSEAISMRGFGENSYGRVLILLNGNKLNDPDMKAANWNAIPLSDIERIEILDGSASVQYGNYAVGGVINIVTKKSGEKKTLIGLSGGSYFTHKEYISHFSPFKWGSFSLSAENTGTDGYRERQFSRSTNVTAGADWFISEKLNLSFNTSFSGLFFQLPGSLTKEQFEDEPKKALVSDGSPNFNDENTEYHFAGGLGLQWLLRENIELNLPLSYRGKIIKSDMASQKNYTYDPVTWDIDEYLGDNYTDRTLHSAEARPQGMISFKPGGMPLRILGGVDFYYTALEGDTYYHKNRTDKWNSSSLSQLTIGPYLTARFSPFSNFSLSAGARFDMAVINAQNMDSTVDDNKHYSAFVYEAGAAYNPIKDLKLYAKYSTLFRYPFIDEVAEIYGYGFDSFNGHLEPEKGFNAEAGASWLYGNMLDINANFFYMILEDEIAWNYDLNRNDNIDKTRRLGTNMGITFSYPEFLSLYGSYSYINAVFMNGENEDKNIPLVPAHKIYGSLTAKLPFGLDFGPNVEYTSTSWFGGDNANSGEKLPSYFLLGARASYVRKINSREFSFIVNVNNLLNKNYSALGFRSSMDGSRYSFYPADGISINITMLYQF